MTFLIVFLAVLAWQLCGVLAAALLFFYGESAKWHKQMSVCEVFKFSLFGVFGLFGALIALSIEWFENSDCTAIAFRKDLA